MIEQIKFSFANVIAKFHKVQIISLIFFDTELRFKNQLYKDACMIYGKQEVDKELNYLQAKFEDGEVVSECKPLQSSAKQVTEANTKTNSNHRLN